MLELPTLLLTYWSWINIITELNWWDQFQTLWGLNIAFARRGGDVEIEIMINWTWRGFCGFHPDAFISLSSIFRVFWCLSQFSTSWSSFPGCWGTSPWSPWWSAAKVSTPRWITILSLSPSPTFSSSYSVSYIKSLPCIFLQHFVIITDGNTTVHNAMHWYRVLVQ